MDHKIFFSMLFFLSILFASSWISAEEYESATHEVVVTDITEMAEFNFIWSGIFPWNTCEVPILLPEGTTYRQSPNQEFVSAKEGISVTSSGHAWIVFAYSTRQEKGDNVITDKVSQIAKITLEQLGANASVDSYLNALLEKHEGGSFQLLDLDDHSVTFVTKENDNYIMRRVFRKVMVSNGTAVELRVAAPVGFSEGPAEKEPIFLALLKVKCL